MEDILDHFTLPMYYYSHVYAFKEKESFTFGYA